MEEAEGLWEALGYILSFQINRQPANLDNKNTNDSSDNGNDDSDDFCDVNDNLASDQAELSKALDAVAGSPVQTDKTLNECGYAATALAISDFEKINALPSLDVESFKMISSQLNLLLNVISIQGPHHQAVVKQAINDAVVAWSNANKGSFGIVHVDGKLMIGQVSTVYACGNRKTAANSWTPEMDNIGCLSYIVVKTWQATSNHRHFQSNWQALSAHLGLPQFIHMHAQNFLYLIPSPHTHQLNNNMLLELKPPMDATCQEFFAD
ncbi:hypothetical protein BDN71DRAFT_1436268 [Pleurotus eryngii]|uniref:Uncharacterized protein n=1 Tax=Pleurotus eryngii TaxID=5323 RepID=A0A9P5ZIS0_PLEER|nr:hypothetical protein BDN71DRAFT_1436268 [Pleurotus eryngii]